jgi:glutamyl-tRNA synthetase
MDSNKPARMRFAPSPTGRFHIGSARTALYTYLYARKTGGQFIIRIEDTDQKRFDPAAEDELFESLRWLGLAWDEGPDVGGPSGPYRQSERMAIYQRYASDLVESGHAYYCFCSPERLAEVRKLQQQRKEPPRYDGHCRRLNPAEAADRAAAGEKHVVRFRTPREGRTTAVDLLRGPIEVENSTIDDYILVKSSGMPVYHLAAMVDDHLMGITHVTRGSEWLPTFPLHVMIYEAFGWDQPVWVHLSVLLNPSGKGKLSKRDSSASGGGAHAIFTLDLRELGYLPEAVVNWVSLMGWSFDDHTEFFTMPDLIQAFSLEKLNPSPAAVNFSKLDHFNGLHIRNLAPEDLTKRLLPFFETAGIEISTADLEPVTPLIQKRIRTLDEAVDMAGFFFRPFTTPPVDELIGKGMTAAESAAAARRAAEVVRAHPALEHEAIENALRQLADELGLKAGQLFGILRGAVTGQRVSPPLIETMEILGIDVVLERIENAAKVLENR